MLKIDCKTAITTSFAAALAALLIGQSSVPAAAAGPSFSCSGNLLPAERTVCENATLAALDVALASLYDNIRNRTSGAALGTLEAQEKAWIAVRDACGTNVVCIGNAYKRRIAQLGG